jgi:hypothetical protein
VPSMRRDYTTSEKIRSILSQDGKVQTDEPKVRVPIQREGAKQKRSFSLDIEQSQLKEVHVGFTGTRRGMTDGQKSKVRSLLEQIIRASQDDKPHLVAHHGDCKGSDEQFHNIATELGFFTIAHPPVNAKLRAYCKADIVKQTKPYKIRNQDIVRESDLLIATPHRHEKDGVSNRSGTWQTVRIARNRKVPYVIFYSDGRTEGGNKWRKLLNK